MPEWSTGILGAITSTSLTVKIIIIAAVTLLVGGGVTAYIVKNRNDIGSEQEIVQAEEEQDEATAEESEAEEDDKATESIQTDTDGVSAPAGDGNSTAPPASTKKTQYRYRDKEFCSKDCDLGWVGDGPDGMVAGNGWVYIETTYTYTAWSEWRTYPRTAGGAGEEVEGNTDGSGQGWRVRTKTPTHHWWRWGAWSSWQDASVNKNANREVETRQL